jgi:hypothetical protein
MEVRKKRLLSTTELPLAIPRKKKASLQGRLPVIPMIAGWFDLKLWPLVLIEGVFFG